MQDNITDKDIERNLLKNDIPSSFLRQNLLSFGGTGSDLSLIFNDPENLKDYFSVLKVLNLHSETGEHEDLLILVIRAFLLLGKSSSIQTPKKLLSYTYEELEELKLKQVIGISHFYNYDYTNCPLTDSQKFTIEDFVNNYIKTGGILILGSTSVFSEQLWYSQYCRNNLSRYGRNLKVVSRD